MWDFIFSPKKKKGEIWISEVGEVQSWESAKTEQKCYGGTVSILDLYFSIKLCCNRNAIGKTFPDYILGSYEKIYYYCYWWLWI